MSFSRDRPGSWRQDSSARGRLLAAIVCAVFVAPAISAQETFTESLVVREASAVVVPPGSGRDLPRPDELSVLVDGLPQRVTGVESVVAKRGGTWRILVWADPALAGARSRFLSALALAQQAERLCQLGEVEVVVADPEPERLLAPDGVWQRVERGLLEIALRAKRELGESGASEPALLAHAAAAPRLDRLLVELAGRGGGGPRVLVLLSDGFVPSAAAAGAPPPAEELARALAAYGWVVVPVAWSERPTEAAHGRLQEYERWKEEAEGRTRAGERRAVIDFGRVFRDLGGGGEPEAAPPVVPELEPLSRLAGATTGRIVRRESDLVAIVGGLARRWLVSYQARAPLDGALRSLEIRRTQRQLEAPRWHRSATPTAVVESRLRLLAHGAVPDGGLDVEAALAAGADGPTLTLSGRRPVGGPLLVSHRPRGSGETTHAIVPLAEPGKRGWQVSVPLPGGAGELLLVVEDLSDGAWAGRRLDG